MTAENPITQLLKAHRGGDRSAADRLFELVYRELHGMAHGQLFRRQPGRTLNTTALVHEAYLKLADRPAGDWQDRGHFFAVAARAMRQILIDHARRRGALKRKTPDRRITLSEASVDGPGIDLLALDEALNELAALDARKSRILELRFFGGLSNPEIAKAWSRIVSAGTSGRTVYADDGRELRVPDDWDLLPPGDAALTRRVKATGPTWTVQEKKGRRTFSRGVWACKQRIAEIRSDLQAERSTEAYAKRRQSDTDRRHRKQADYVEDFRAAVLAFLDFAPRHTRLAQQLADAVTLHATPVGSGTVARTQRIPISRRAESAVIAWLRHQTTAYDHMTIPRVKGQRREIRRIKGQSVGEAVALSRAIRRSLNDSLSAATCPREGLAAVIAPLLRIEVKRRLDQGREGGKVGHTLFSRDSSSQESINSTEPRSNPHRIAGSMKPSRVPPYSRRSQSPAGSWSTSNRFSISATRTLPGGAWSSVFWMMPHRAPSDSSQRT